jgi:hypothetical protein
MATFEILSTREPAGNGHNMMADVFVQPPLTFSSELGEMVAKLAGVEHVGIEEVGGVPASQTQHLRIESKSFKKSEVHDALSKSLEVLKNYHTAMADADIAGVSGALGLNRKSA